MKKVLVSLSAALLLAGFAFSQATSGNSGTTNGSTGAKEEKTVEEAYLAETYEGKIILEYAQADTKAGKMDALLYIKEALDGGRKNEDMQHALDLLSLEGTLNASRAGGVGRVMNNYPEVRAKACEYLGVIGSAEAKKTLVKVVLTDNEPMVLASAIRALGTIPSANDEETLQSIAWVVNRYDILLPDNTLAFETVIAIERIADRDNGIKDPSIARLLMRIAEGNYITIVRAKAKEVMSKLRKYSGPGNGNSSKK